MGDKEVDDLHVDVLEFPATSFEVFNNNLLYTAAETDALVHAHGDQEDGLLAGPAVGTPNTEQVSVRRSVPVPFDLVEPVLDMSYSPIQFWIRFIRPNLGDTAWVASHQPVVDWAHAAVTRVAAAAPARGGAAPADDPPIVRAGTFDAYFPAIRLDRRLNQFTHSLIRKDFPQYAADPVDNTDRVLAVVGAIRADTAHERAEAARDQATREACKTPAQKYPHSVRYMRRLAGLPDDSSQDVQLPELAHELANAKSSEHRSCLQAQFTL